jgi:hypothetical protein
MFKVVCKSIYNSITNNTQNIPLGLAPREQNGNFDVPFARAEPGGTRIIENSNYINLNANSDYVIY